MCVGLGFDRAVLLLRLPGQATMTVKVGAQVRLQPQQQQHSTQASPVNTTQP
jgi:hypothetical protein